MKPFLLSLLSASAVSSVLALLLLVFSPALAKRYSARAVSAAFLIVLLSFFALWQPEMKPAAVRVTVPQARTQAVRLPVNAAYKTPEAAVSIRANEAVNALPARTADLYEVLFFVWLSGAVFVTLFEALRHARFLRCVRRWQRRAPKNYRAAVMEKARQMNLRRAPEVYVCPVVDGPMLTGVFGPRVLIPFADMDDAALAPVIRHELTHLKRRDVLRRLIALMALSFHWFNPLAWLAARAQAFYAELACDEAVTAGEDFSARKNYAQAILLSVRGGAGKRTALSTGFKGGKKEMSKRIEAVLSTKKKRVGTLLVCLILTAAMALSGALALTEDTGSGNTKTSTSLIAQSPTATPDLPQPTPTPTATPDVPQPTPTPTPVPFGDGGSDALAVLSQANVQYTGEYGAFAFWPPEVKGAYSEFCLAAGTLPDDGYVYYRPANDEISELAAVYIAAGYMSVENVLQSFEYGAGIIQQGNERCWQISLYASRQDSDMQECAICLINAKTGNPVFSAVPDGFLEGVKTAAAQKSRYAELFAQYGSNDFFWPIEAKAEYAALLGNDVGYAANEPVNVMPEANDLSLSNARSIAAQEYNRVFGSLPEQELVTEKGTHFYIIMGEAFRAQKGENETRWYQMDFMGSDTAFESDHTVYLGGVKISSPDGKILENTLGMDNAIAYEQNLDINQQLEAKLAADGMWVTWPFEEIQKFKDVLGYAGIDIFRTPAQGQISMEDAVKIARKIIADKVQTYQPQAFYGVRDAQKLTPELVDSFKSCAILCSETEDGSGTAYWQVFLYEDEWFSVGLLDCFDVRIDPGTGEVIDFFEPGGNG